MAVSCWGYANWGGRPLFHWGASQTSWQAHFTELNLPLGTATMRQISGFVGFSLVLSTCLLLTLWQTTRPILAWAVVVCVWLLAVTVTLQVPAAQVGWNPAAWLLGRTGSWTAVAGAVAALAGTGWLGARFAQGRAVV